MAKAKNKKSRASTADLVIAHSRKHLAFRPHLLVRESLPESWSRIFAPLVFGLAGLVVIAAALQIVTSADVAQSNFVAENATNYAAQREFYSGDSEMLHAAADFSAAREKVHAAAVASELSRILNVLGVILVFGGLFYLHEKHNIFCANRAGFRIRKIRK